MAAAEELDYLTYTRNRANFPEAELERYWGRHVAWNFEGTRILADGATMKELFARLDEMGIDPCATVSDFIRDPDTSYI